MADKQMSTNKYTYINATAAHADTMFSISAQGRSAKDKIDELLYAHTYCTETAAINTIPIYYLQPNSKIRIIDEETNLNGCYTISKISLPLTYNGIMSLTATRAAETTL
jgi:hypothetical protein